MPITSNQRFELHEFLCQIPKVLFGFQAVTGKAILFGYDVVGKPAFYMIPSRQNTDDATRQIQFTIWVLERGIDLMEPGVE